MYQKKMIHAHLQAQENERQRIAADLHDTIIGKLTVLRMKAALKHSPHEIDSLLGIAIDESRRISHDLAPPMVEEKLLDELLKGLLESWKIHFKIDSKFVTLSERKMSSSFKLQVLRIVQELINNAWNHSKASKITLHYRKTNKYVVFVFADNGIGIEELPKERGIGLQNIDLRVENVGGKFKYKSKKNEGTRFIFVLKYNSKIVSYKGYKDHQ